MSNHVKKFVTVWLKLNITLLPKYIKKNRITPKTIKSNNDPVLSLPKFYASKCLIHKKIKKKSCVKTPHQNGRVEKRYQQILNVGRTLMFQSKLPKSFWFYVVIHVVVLINRVTTPLLQHKSPFQTLFNTIPKKKIFLKFLVAYVTLPLYKHTEPN